MFDYDYVPLECIDGSIVAVQCPSIRIARQVQFHLSQLMGLFVEYQIPLAPATLNVTEYHDLNMLALDWPDWLIPEQLDVDVPQFILEKFWHELQTIAILLPNNRSKDGSWLKDLTPTVFHDFLICGKPHPSPLDPQKMVQGLTGLQVLLGQRYPDGSDLGEDAIVPETDDPHAILLASLLLTFEGTSPQHWLDMPAPLCDRILVEGSAMRKRAEERAKREAKEEQTHQYAPNVLPARNSNVPFAEVPAEELFEAKKSDIQKSLESFNIPMPKNF